MGAVKTAAVRPQILQGLNQGGFGCLRTVGKFKCNHSTTMRPTLALQIGKIYSNTTQWLGRTVMVQGNDVEQAMNVLNGIMANEGMVKRFKLTRRYEKPKYARSRINFER